MSYPQSIQVWIEPRQASEPRVRAALSDYTGSSDSSFKLAREPKGKPYVVDSDLAFSVSYSGEWMAIVVGRNCRLGIDLECLTRKVSNQDRLVTRFFSIHEQAAYIALEDTEKQAGFFRAWCRKEAVVKAMGSGISYGLDRFDVSLTEQAELLEIRDETESVESWKLYNLTGLPDGFIGALAIAAN